MRVLNGKGGEGGSGRSQPGQGAKMYGIGAKKFWKADKNGRTGGGGQKVPGLGAELNKGSYNVDKISFVQFGLYHAPPHIVKKSRPSKAAGRLFQIGKVWRVFPAADNMFVDG